MENKCYWSYVWKNKRKKKRMISRIWTWTMLWMVDLGGHRQGNHAGVKLPMLNWGACRIYPDGAPWETAPDDYLMPWFSTFTVHWNHKELQNPGQAELSPGQGNQKVCEGGLWSWVIFKQAMLLGELTIMVFTAGLKDIKIFPPILHSWFLHFKRGIMILRCFTGALWETITIWKSFESHG